MRRILATNYEIPQFSDDEDDPVGELTLDTIQKPVIMAPSEVPEEEKQDALINNTTIEDYLKNTLSQLNLVKTLNQF